MLYFLHNYQSHANSYVKQFFFKKKIKIYIQDDNVLFYSLNNFICTLFAFLIFVRQEQILKIDSALQ